ncbi:dual specificity protein kinase splA-like [Anopheles nili]|uniref:dual specificity protein kinase splA-like n=1 Tax=Anopheles nili TaxID=185578 RepID=UPI00237C2994|nr:dual specificity protein kinase splA-like [Anopheles nili]
MGKISGSHCLVLGCRNRQLLNQTNTRSYFRFPRDADLCKKWVDFCNRPELYKKYDENGPEYLYKSSRICSDHFQPADFNNANLFSQGLKKGSIPSVNPASKETKPNGFTSSTGGGGVGGGGGGAGSGSSNGADSPIDEKLLSAVAAIPVIHPNLLLMMAANQLANPSNRHKRPSSAMSGMAAAVASLVAGQAASGGGTTTTTTPTAPTTPVSSSGGSNKRNRAVPPLAAPTGALANLIQRQQQIKEQQRKAAALAASGLVNGQVSITPAVVGPATSPTGSNGSSNGCGPISLVTKKSSNNHHNNNNNNNNVSNHNHNHHHQQQQSGGGKIRARDGSHSEYGINVVDMDMTGGESSEGDSSYQNSADEDFAYHQRLKVAKVEAVIPPSLKSQLTVTPALGASIVPSVGITTINNNSIHNVNANGTAGVTELNLDYKEKYEQTLKELFACRRIVKNQNKAIKQQQGEIDFLNQLLKEK